MLIVVASSGVVLTSTQRRSIIELIVFAVLFIAAGILFGTQGLLIVLGILVVYALVGVGRKFSVVKETALGTARAVASEKQAKKNS